LPLMKQGIFSRQEMESRAQELLAAVGLGEKASRLATHLSGGEQQRVAVARSLVNRPRVLLADEPTGNLDSANSEVVFSLLLQAVREQGLTLLMVTHNEDIARRCDHTLHMTDGQLTSIQSAAADALP
jgi:lipoprotein-releasing system ATP-binding protein